MKRARIIAEISSNHLGDLELAKEHIHAAAECGADFVKFQSWQSKELSPSWLKDLDYYEQTELSDDDHYELLACCQKHNVQFLTTVFSLSRVDFLKELSPSYIKIASIDSTSASLINRCKDSFRHLIISTGMRFEDEVSWLAYLLRGYEYTLLHCVSEYPTTHENQRMARMEWLKDFSLNVGLSCHATDIFAAQVAIARGASMIEKHFILEHNDRARDSKVSILPNQLKELCLFRDAVELMDSDKSVDPTEEELLVRDKYTGKWGDNR